MKNNFKKSLIAIIGAVGTLFLGGCFIREPEALYGSPADFLRKDSNEDIYKYTKKKNSSSEIKELIELIDYKNMYYAGKIKEFDFPTIEYDGPTVDELEEKAKYEVEVLELSEDEFITKVGVSKVK